MRSMIYLKKAGGTVKVYSKDTVDEMVDDSMREKTEMELVKKRQKYVRKKDLRAVSAPVSTVSVGSGSQTIQSVRTQDWLNESTIKELQDKASNEGHATKQLYTSFMERENTFVKSLEDYLAHKEFTDLRKKELLHKRWTDQVYEPIRKKILETIDKSDWNSIDNHKREMHGKFLEHVNKRGVVFLNNEKEEEHSVEALNAPAKVKTQPLLDPLHIESQQRLEEEKTILLCMTGHHFTDSDLKQVRLPPLSLDPKGQYGVTGSHSLKTPHYSIENLSRNNNRHMLYGDSAKTSFDYRVWAAEGCDAKIAAQELQIPRKRMFATLPPFGKPTAAIPRPPFIDPEDFADKIVNTNPWAVHMEHLRTEAEAMRECHQIQQHAEELEQKQICSQENQQQEEIENNEQSLENSQNQQLMESDQKQLMENDQ